MICLHPHQSAYTCPLAGYEPRRLFNVVQFVMNDKEGSGNVSLEGAMQILYLRYGRGLLDSQLEEIFGTSDLNSGKLLQPCLALKLTVNECIGHKSTMAKTSLPASIYSTHVTCGAGKTLTLTEFLQSLHLSQIKQLRNRVTAKTYKPPPLPTKRSAAV